MTTLQENQSGYKVLIVDDVFDNLKVLSNILYNRGINISVATSGEQALRTVAVKPPDLILLDIAMPGMDGFEVCKILKDNALYKNIPIIFLTAKSESRDVIKGFELGAVDYVTKPFNPYELVSRVFTHLELKKSKDIILAQNEKLKELNERKDKFFSILAHDLRTPFCTLINISELLVNHIDKFNKEKLQQFGQRIHNTSEKGFNLLQNLLNWSRSQANSLEIEREVLDMDQLVQASIDMFTINAQHKNIEIIYTPKQIYINADKNMISTVLSNLLSNAIKFTPHNGKIEVVTYQKNEKFVCEIIDSGVGISTENLTKLFRIDINFTTNGTDNEKGTGLGLILCKEFIDKNDGIISAESNLGQGTTFRFSLPMHKLTTD